MQLRIEWFKFGCWIGSTNSNLTKIYEKEALDFLSSNPDRYFYPNRSTKVRISFDEPR